MARDRFGHRAATGIAEADEEHLGFLRRLVSRFFRRWVDHNCWPPLLSLGEKLGGGKLRPYKGERLYGARCVASVVGAGTGADDSAASDFDSRAATGSAAIRTKNSWTAELEV